MHNRYSHISRSENETTGFLCAVLSLKFLLLRVSLEELINSGSGGQKLLYLLLLVNDGLGHLVADVLSSGSCVLAKLVEPGLEGSADDTLGDRNTTSSVVMLDSKWALPGISFAVTGTAPCRSLARL